ncbi:UDP-GlcNAc--UDP-phosphate GlcNAc-1-phosphate transferase, partial [Chryseobacterium sp. HMWF035]
MEFSIVTILLFISMLIYFRIADKYNIIDKPNHR